MRPKRESKIIIKLQQGLGDTLFAKPFAGALDADVMTCWPQLFGLWTKCYGRATRLWTQSANLERTALTAAKADLELQYQAPSSQSILQQYEQQLKCNFDQSFATLPFGKYHQHDNLLLPNGYFATDVPLLIVRSHSYRAEYPAPGRNPDIEQYRAAIEEYNKQGYTTVEVGWWDDKNEIAAKLPVQYRINRQPIETVLRLLLTSKIIIGPVGWICAFSMYHKIPTKIFKPADCDWDNIDFWFDSRAPKNLEYYEKS